MQIIVIEMEAFARLQDQLELLGPAISADRIGQAGLQGRKIVINPELILSRRASTLASQFFLRVVATSKIAHRPTCLLGSLMSARFNSSGYPLSKRPELFEQHATATQIKIHLSRIKQHPQTSAETNPIKAAQNMRDLVAKFVIKTFRNAVCCWCGLVFHPPLLPTPRALQHPRSLVAATPR